MNFRDERKRYFESFFARLMLHMLVSVLGWGTAYLALVGSSWVPILLFLAFVVVLEGMYLYDCL